MASRRPLTVVKLGGSYAFSPVLGDWLEMVARNAGHVVLVPGGGPFADAVREAQPKMGFDEVAAHHMALLAMEQYGRALVSLNETLALASSVAAIGRLLSARKISGVGADAHGARSCRYSEFLGCDQRQSCGLACAQVARPAIVAHQTDRSPG